MPATTDPKPKREPRFWSSNREWSRGEASPKLDVPWSSMYADYACDLPRVFLGKLRHASQLAKSPQWIVRDGLIPLLTFFARFPKPDRKLKTRLYIHADWVEFVPEPWQKLCHRYALVPTADPELFAEPVPLKKRTRWVTAAHLSAGFCSMPHLEKTMAAVRANPRLARLRESAPLLGHFELAYGPAYIVRFLRALNDTLRGEFAELDSGTLQHFSDFRDTVVLDLNERLLCSDDAHLHLFYARGAVPGLRPAAMPGAWVHRLSPYHGFSLAPLPSSIQPFFEDRDAMEFMNYLQAIPSGTDFPGALPFGPVPRWVIGLVMSRYYAREVRGISHSLPAPAAAEALRPAPSPLETLFRIPPPTPEEAKALT